MSGNKSVKKGRRGRRERGGNSTATKVEVRKMAGWEEKAPEKVRSDEEVERGVVAEQEWRVCGEKNVSERGNESDSDKQNGEQYNEMKVKNMAKKTERRLEREKRGAK